MWNMMICRGNPRRGEKELKEEEFSCYPGLQPLWFTFPHCNEVINQQRGKWNKYHLVIVCGLADFLIAKKKYGYLFATVA